jgi:hypothetical protein
LSTKVTNLQPETRNLVKKDERPFGKAILDYQTNNSPEDLITETTISEEDEMSVAYLFRSYKEMPTMNNKSSTACQRKDWTGCGAEASLYLQNELNLEVTA